MYIPFFITLTMTIFCLAVYFLSNPSIGKNKRVMSRIAEFSPKKQEQIDEAPLLIRVMQAPIQRLSLFLSWITPVKYKRHLQQKLFKLDQRFSLKDILIVKFLLLIVGFAFILLFSWYTSFHFMYILIIAAASFIPDIFISRLIKKRKQEVNMELPAFMEMLTVILGAGISFDNAVQKICERKQGPLYKEFTYYINQLKIGTPKEEALKNAAARIQLKDFDSLIRSIIQGEKMGISIITTINLQADQLRIKRKLRIEEQAAKIPVKILFPIIMCIFPPILLIIIGPGAIQIFESFF